MLDSVAAVFPDPLINEVLAAIHRLGHGHHARLIRGDHLDFTSQLERSCIPRDIQVAISVDVAASVLVIEAPHQTARVADLLLGLGAIKVERFATSQPFSAVLSFDTSSLDSRSRRRSPRTASR